MKKKHIKTLIALHILLMVNSTSGIFSKLAAGEPPLSWNFCLYYGAIIFLLGVYAIGWQQIIKRIPLSSAFANKAVTVVWNIIWGSIFFKEIITAGKLVGAVLVMIGVVLFATDTREDSNG